MSAKLLPAEWRVELRNPLTELTIVDALAPFVADTRGLVDLRRELTTAFPAADSIAMAERLEDAKLADTWSDQPVTDAQNYALMLLHVVEDHLESLCHLLDKPGWVPVWGLGPPARAVLEAAGRTAYLANVGLGARARVEAYMNERLFALATIGDLPAGAKDQEAVAGDREQILASAERRGFKRRPHHDAAKASIGRLAAPAQLGSGRPGDLDAVRRLFGDPPELGKGTYQWVSAVAHATAWEVEKHFRPTRRDAVGLVSVELGRDPRDVYQFLNAAVLGYAVSVTGFFALWGCQDVRWNKAAVNSIRICRTVGELIERSAPR